MSAPRATDFAAAKAQDSVDAIIKEDEDKHRVPVYTFDPDASPQQKGASAGKARDQVKSLAALDQDGTAAKELPLDTGKSNMVPTINIQDTDTLDAAQAVDSAVDIDRAIPAGAFPDAAAPVIPSWYKVGWRAVSGIDSPQLEQGEEQDKGFLDMFISEQFYGDWYHNAAVIIFAVFTTHFLTRFHFGFGWLFLILAACTTYYSTSVSRFRRRARDDIQRELVKVRLINEHESADWINNFLDRFWLIYEPVLSETIVSSVDQVLSTNTPPFLDSLRLTTFTLGSKAPRIDKVRTFPHTAEDIIVMDWGISFTPSDISDMTPKQADNQVNPKIVLSIRVGKGLATASMPVLLEDINFSGLMRIRLKLMNNFPHVQVLSFSFLEKPVIDYVLKPLGGETFGIDINSIPGLSAFIREMTHSTLGPMMYDPNSYTLNLEQLLSGAPLDTAIGVLRVTVYSARNLKGNKIGGGSPDPFVCFSINDRAELARTKYRSNTYNPTWNETKFLLVSSLMGSLVMTIYDYNDHRKNTLMGSATVALEALKDDATQEGLEPLILKDGKERGQLRCDVSFYPVLKPQTVNGKEELPETTVGIVRLVIHQAKDLDASKSLAGELNPFAVVVLGSNPVPIHSTQSTRHTKHTNNPIWESATEFLCSDKDASIISVKVIDDRDFLKDPLVGYLSIRLIDLLQAQKEAGRDWWPLSGCKTGRVRMSAEWKALNIPGNLQGAHQYSPPIGVVKLFMDKATDVRNVEALGGKSDPYVRVLVNNVIMARTDVISNDLNPKWNQILHIPVHSLKETLLLECMDYQTIGKDRFLGSVEIRVSELAQPGDDKRYPYESTGLKKAEDPIQLGGGDIYKGTMHYTAQFVSALALKFDKFTDRPNELQAIASGSGEGGGDAVDNGTNVHTPPIPEGITAWHPHGAGAAEKSREKKSTDSESTHTSSTSPTTDNKEADNSALNAVELSQDELLKQQSGILVLNIISGELTKRARVEVVLDDSYWPAFATVKARSTTACWEHVGETFIKELDFSQMSLRLDESSNDDKDQIIAEWKGDVKAFLEMALDGPHSFELVHKDERATSRVEIEARYIPVPVELEAREKMSNQGMLRVDLLDGSDISGVDRTGKSDPYAVFTLNGQKVFKSQTKKKTLSPDWNENFTVPVPSRVDSDFSVEIFDWNQIEQAKSLGTAKIDLADLEPFNGSDRSLNLTSAKLGEKGVIRIRLLFRPEFIVKTRKTTSTLSSATRTMTNIGAAPLGAGKGVIQGVAGVFKRDKNKEDDSLPAVPDAPAGQVSRPLPLPEPFPSMPATAPVENGANVASESGSLRVTVVDGKDLSWSDVKPYVVLRLGSGEYKTKHSGKTLMPEWNETFSFPASPMTPKLYLWVFDHKTLAKDKVLAEAEVDIWSHVQLGSNSSAEVSVELSGGTGQLRLRLDYLADTTPIGRTSSTVSVNRNAGLSSPSRFSIRGGRRPPTFNASDQEA